MHPRLKHAQQLLLQIQDGRFVVSSTDRTATCAPTPSPAPLPLVLLPLVASSRSVSTRKRNTARNRQLRRKEVHTRLARSKVAERVVAAATRNHVEPAHLCSHWAYPPTRLGTLLEVHGPHTLHWRTSFDFYWHETQEVMVHVFR